MLNISSTPRSRAEQELRTVNLQLMRVIQYAHCWHDIAKAADAMFHARLIWQSTYKEIFEQKSEGGAPTAPATPEQGARP